MSTPMCYTYSTSMYIYSERGTYLLIKLCGGERERESSVGIENGWAAANSCGREERGGTICGDDGAFVFFWMWEEN